MFQTNILYRKGLRRHFPLCFVSEDTICTYKSGNFYIVNIHNGRIEFLASFNIHSSELLLSKSKVLSRLFRTGVRYGKFISPRNILFVHNKIIYNLNIETKKITAEHNLLKGSRPLSISNIHHIEGFEDGFYFGEYFSNPSKKAVNIYKREESGSWHIVGSFRDGLINHIHAIIPDHIEHCVWILSGDFDNAAGIWYAKDNFRTIEPVLVGDQNYRACVAFPTENGLLYATDTPFSQNSIRILSRSENSWASTKVVDIDGPVIYGCVTGKKYIFSTSVEGNGTENGLKMIIGRARGKGIKEPYSYIYSGDLEVGFKKIFIGKKDFLPFVLFQFGVVLFPEGENKTDILSFYPVALNKYDQTLYSIKIDT